MTKAELVKAVAEKAGLSKADAEKAWDAVWGVVKAELVKGEDVPVAGVGTFKVAGRAARDGVNPLTKKPLHIPAKKVVVFKPGKALKEEVNK